MTPLTTPLGSFPDHDEFQEGDALVFVRFVPEWSREEALGVARRPWPQVGAAGGGVRREAEAFAWQQWGSPDLTPPEGGLLQVRSIEIEPLSGSVTYTLGLGEGVSPPRHLPDHLEEVEFTVHRLFSLGEAEG